MTALYRRTLFISGVVAMPTVHEQVHKWAQEHQSIGQIARHVGCVCRCQVVACNADYGKDFRADLGFINRVNFREQIINPSYTWRPAPGALLTQIGVWGQWDKSWDQDERELEEESRVGFYINGPMQSFAEIGGGFRQRF